jgi:hypothetical protein
LEKTKTLTSLCYGFPVTIDTDTKREVRTLLNVFLLCEKFGWTPEYVYGMDYALYKDFLSISNLLTKIRNDNGGRSKNKSLARG